MTIRPARDEDLAAIASLIDRAFAPYVERLDGERPRPMDADHAAAVAEGRTHVADEDGEVAGVLVLEEHPGHLLVDVVAADPRRRGQGVGRRLLAHAEDLARQRGLAELRLYTNVVMTENLALYPRLGFTETGRAQVGPFTRVAFAKPLTSARAGAGPATRP